VKRRIGSIIRESAAIVAFRQHGDQFRRVSVIDRSDTAAFASALLTLSVPTGIIVRPLLAVGLSAGASVTCVLHFGDAGGLLVPLATAQVGSSDSADNTSIPVPDFVITNTSAQIQFSSSTPPARHRQAH
jgi:hypothetical protein